MSRAVVTAPADTSRPAGTTRPAATTPSATTTRRAAALVPRATRSAPAPTPRTLGRSPR